MLWVFSLAITPWSALHHHEQAPEVAVEKHCTHKVHVKTQQETCLICAAHFEKNYTTTENTYITYLSSKLMSKNISSVSSSYAELIATSLRGPPAFS
ncbi:hypothetical protein VRU48_13845 [Pedobacter sp. KR3-3]|uniref:Secreted protein n=1 Tax=Pedobacter albus TaxID=3113905 RepID=A0ABU7I9Q8_9SPHI|nr:hypothetical protein [Pedobacter sp. KR3-3]MEE1946201.1 hypothetical protein [Pedobacter sp. KR3-3]